MTETFSETRKAYERFKSNWRNADEDSRYRTAFWLTGTALIGTALVTQFGWIGAIFCAGAILRFAGTSHD